MTTSGPSGKTFEDRLLKATAEEAGGAVNEAGDRATALVEAWVRAANAAAVVEVAERGSGPARKAARRGLNVLKSRGVAIPERARVATLAARTEEVLEAWMMPPDATGTELFAIASRAATSRGRVTLVYLHASRGVLRVDNRRLSQSGLKDYFKQVLPSAGYGAVRVPVDWARHRIAAARKRHSESGFPEPMGFSTAADLLDGAPPEPPPHPFDEEGFVLSDEDARETAKGSGALHRLPEFRSFLPTNAAMQDLLVAVGKKIKPGESPEPAVVTGYLQEEIDSATDRYFSPQERQDLVALMKDSALSVLAREGESRALELAAVMQAINACGLITDPPHEVPFLRGFFEKAVSMMIAQGGGRLRLPVPTAPLEAEAAAGPANDEAESTADEPGDAVSPPPADSNEDPAT